MLDVSLNAPAPPLKALQVVTTSVARCIARIRETKLGSNTASV
jgi:hypothetical protein